MYLRNKCCGRRDERWREEKKDSCFRYRAVLDKNNLCVLWLSLQHTLEILKRSLIFNARSLQLPVPWNSSFKTMILLWRHMPYPHKQPLYDLATSQDKELEASDPENPFYFSLCICHMCEHLAESPAEGLTWAGWRKNKGTLPIIKRQVAVSIF